MQKKSFTLIELLIVLVIMGIVIAVGYPSYNRYLVEGRRQDAIQSILALQVLVEQQIALNNTLPSTNLPSTWGYTSSSQNGFYTLAYTQVNASTLTYQITATANAGTTQVKDFIAQGSTTINCTVLTLINNIEGITGISTTSGVNSASYACK